MQSDFEPATVRENAYRLHKQGELVKAAVLYEAILALNGRDADVGGLLALCQYQMGRKAESIRLWWEVLQWKAVGRVQWRNVNNFFAVVLSGDTEPSQEALHAVSLLPWPSATTPTSDDLSLALSLGQALNKLGRARDVTPAFLTFAEQLDFSIPESLTFLRWSVEAGHLGLIEAAGIERLAAAAITFPEVYLLLAAYHFCRGNEPASRALTTKAAEIVPVFALPRQKEQKFVVGVLNRPTPLVTGAANLAQFHFSENTTAGLVNRFSSDFQFVSVFPFQVAAKDVHKTHPGIQFFVNNWATAEILATPGTLQYISAFSAELGLPILNRPEVVAKTSRQQVSETLQGIDGLLVPKVLRFYNNHASVISTALLLERELGFPLILRDPFQQMGRGVLKIEDALGLLTALRSFPQTQVYAIQYVDNPVTEGIYRKLRAAVVGDELFVTHVLYREEWNVHREKDDTLRRKLELHPANAGFVDRVTEDPKSVLGSAAMENLYLIRDRIALDIFGIDFDLMPDGRLLLFEANAAMHISFADKYGFGHVRKKMLGALDRLFERAARGV